MHTAAWILFIAPLLLAGYAYAGYPLLLRFLARFRAAPQPLAAQVEWPLVSISLPVYNEARQIRGVLESLLALDYPAGRRQIVVVSDASTDGTDDIVREFAARGVELIRLPARAGKTAGENAAAPHLRGEIVVNTDASVRIRPDALKALVIRFGDPAVGVASGRDVSVGRADEDANAAESGYVGYEMWVRSLETRLGGIVGASGCFYAIRTQLHRVPLPVHLSRDFASAMIAHEHGYRAVSVHEAVCAVPRTSSLRREYRRKVRTMARGMETLWFKRHLLNPMRHGTFAWTLSSHKLCRWMVPWASIGGIAGLALLGRDHPWALALLTSAAGVALLAGLGWLWPEGRPTPRLLSVPAFAVAGNVATLHATIKAVQCDENPTWEPTRRDVVVGAR